MGFFTSLFGQKGKVRFEVETVDGRLISGKTAFESFNYDNTELAESIKDKFFTETGIVPKNVKIIAININ